MVIRGTGRGGGSEHPWSLSTRMTQSALRALERCETCSDDPCGFLPPQRDDCAIVHVEVHEMVHDLADVPIRERQRRAICQDNTQDHRRLSQTRRARKSRKSESVSILQAWRMSCWSWTESELLSKGYSSVLFITARSVKWSAIAILSGLARLKRDRKKASQSYPRTIRCPTTGTVDGPACRRGSCSLNTQARVRRTQPQGKPHSRLAGLVRGEGRTVRGGDAACR
eukprot:COSAG04_NODE_746_length_10633_cov_8.922456_6_plen_226_part_00